MKKAEQLASTLNAENSSDFRIVAEATAAAIGVGLYWYGTAEPAPKNATAEVWKIKNGTWVKRIGEIVRGHDGVWRA